MVTPLLSQGVGYGVGKPVLHPHSCLSSGTDFDWEVIGIGLFFSALMIALTWAQARYTGIKPDEAEEFTSASRSVKPGLIASAVVSAWTWAATLVRSILHNHTISPPSLCTLYAMAAYLTSFYIAAKQCRGISIRHLGPLLVCFRGNHSGSAFCTGTSRLLSAFQAMKLLTGTVSLARSKIETQCTLCPHFPRNHRNSMGQPRPLRVPDVWVGSHISSFSLGHYVLSCYSLATNIIVSSMLILGGSATVTSLTGMNTIAVCRLLNCTVG
jgi:hypothetical protein